MVVGLLGILKAGGAYVPLIPTLRRERLGLMLEDARPALVLTQERLLASGCRRGIAAFCLDPGRRAGRQPARADPARARLSRRTSLTSSTPRARPARRRASRSNIAVVNLRPDTSRYASWPPSEHDDADRPVLPSTLRTFEWGPLLTGRQVAIMPPGPCNDRPAGAGSERRQVTVLQPHRRRCSMRLTPEALQVCDCTCSPAAMSCPAPVHDLLAMPPTAA